MRCGSNLTSVFFLWQREYSIHHNLHLILTMAYCETTVTPLLTHWSYSAVLHKDTEIMKYLPIVVSPLPFAPIYSPPHLSGVPLVKTSTPEAKTTSSNDQNGPGPDMLYKIPNSKVDVAHMGPICGRQVGPGGPLELWYLGYLYRKRLPRPCLKCTILPLKEYYYNQLYHLMLTHSMSSTLKGVTDLCKHWFR